MQPESNRGRITKWMVTALGVALVAVIYFSPRARSAPAHLPDVSERAAALLVQGREQVILTNAVACDSRDSLNRAIDLAGDRLAMSRFIGSRGSGCIHLPAGTNTVVEEVRSPYVRFRPLGDPTSRWALAYIYADSSVD